MAVVLLLGVAVTVFAQESLVDALATADFEKTWSVEVGSGYPPIHATLGGGANMNRSLASSGQFVTDLTPLSFTLAGVMRTSERWEMKLIADFAWHNCAVKQFDTFGVDPNGQPRYIIDYDNAQYIGRRNTGYTLSLAFTFRRIWNPSKAFQVYSEFGGGIFNRPTSAIISKLYLCSFSLTPIGVRYCWDHLYLFAEIPFSPYATLIHGGLGWKF